MLFVRGSAVGGKAAIEERIMKLTECFLSIKVCATHHHFPALVSRIDNDVVTVTGVTIQPRSGGIFF